MSRVLLLSGPLTLRGMSLYTVSLARELKLRGHKVAVLSPGGILEGALDEQDVPVIHAPVHGPLWRDALYLGVLEDLAAQFDPEVLHVQSASVGPIGALLARRLDLPAVITVHAQLSKPLRLRFGASMIAIAVSEDVRQALVTSGRFPREQIEVIPNGVSASLSALEEEPRASGELPVVGTVSRLARGRGIDHFLEAARRVLDLGAAAHFLVIGEGPAERELRRRARELELVDHVTFALPRARISDLFRPIDLYVSAGESEGHGIFILGAMAEARPVICTGVGGVLSFVRDGENGLLLPRGDVDGLAQRIVGLLGAPEERRRLGREALRDVRENYPMHKVIERTVELYERARAAASVALHPG